MEVEVAVAHVQVQLEVVERNSVVGTGLVHSQILIRRSMIVVVVEVDAIREKEVRDRNNKHNQLSMKNKAV